MLSWSGQCERQWLCNENAHHHAWGARCTLKVREGDRDHCTQQVRQGELSRIAFDDRTLRLSPYRYRNSLGRALEEDDLLGQGYTSRPNPNPNLDKGDLLSQGHSMELRILGLFMQNWSQD